MEERREIFSQYWRVILKESNRKASHKLSIRVRIVAAIVSFLAAIIPFILKNEISSESIKDALLSAGLTILIWCILWLACFSYYFWIEPAIIYDLQNLEIKELKQELTPDNPFEISLRSPEFPKTGRVHVGIDIKNNSMSPVTFSVCVQTHEMKNPEILMPLLFYKSTDDDCLNIRLNQKTTFPFYFACAEEGWPNAILNTTSDNFRKIFPGSYDLIVSVQGVNKNGNLISASEKFTLVYEGDSKLELRNR